jgi:hypothetical protein
MTNEFDDTEDGLWWENSDLDCLDLKNYLEVYVDSERETGRTSKEDGEQINVLDLSIRFSVDVYFFTQRSSTFEYWQFLL